MKFVMGYPNIITAYLKNFWKMVWNFFLIELETLSKTEFFGKFKIMRFKTNFTPLHDRVAIKPIVQKEKQNYLSLRWTCYTNSNYVVKSFLSDDTFRNQVVIIEIDDKMRIGLKAANVECFSWSSIKLISIDKYLEIFDDSAVAGASMLVLARHRVLAHQLRNIQLD